MKTAISGKKILLVEDEALIAMNESELLKSYGADVLNAYDAQEAIEKATSENIDLILMDIDLGEGKTNGTEASEIILRNKEIPIVFCTSHSEKEMVDKVKGITRYGYILKNAGEFVLIESINMAFELFYSHRDINRANAEWSKTFNAVKEIVTVISKDHEILQINDPGCKALGLDKKDILNKKCYELVHRTTAPIAECPCAEALKTSKPCFSEYSEQEHSYELSAWPIYEPGEKTISSFVHVIKDITERKNAEKKLEEIARKYSNLFNSIYDAILVTDINREIIECNPAFTEIFGYSLDEIIGKKTLTLYKDKEEFKQLGKALAEHSGLNSNFLFTVHYMRKNGTVFPGETNVFYLHDEEGNNTGFIGLIRDISNRTIS